MVKNLPANVGDRGDVGSMPHSARSLGVDPTPVFLPGKCNGQSSLASYSPQNTKGGTRLSN